MAAPGLRDWYKHHPRPPVVGNKEARRAEQSGDNHWRYQEEEDPDGVLEGAKALEDRAQVHESAVKYAEQLFEQVVHQSNLTSSSSNMVLAHRWSVHAASHA